MRMTTSLNRIEKFKSFVYKKVFMEEIDEEETMVVEIKPRKNAKPVCQVCILVTSRAIIYLFVVGHCFEPAKECHS